MRSQVGVAILAALISGMALAQFPQPGGDRGGFGGDRGGFGRGGGFGGPGGGGFDPSQFAGMAFDRASNGKPTITISEYTSRMDPEASKKLAEWASKRGISSGQVNRDQFSEYFKERMNERMSQGGGMMRFGGGPPGGPSPSGNDPGAQPGGGPTGPGGMDPDAFAKQRFEQYDTNKDGQLDQTEAQASSRLRESFLEVDSDKNGLVSLSEYTQYIRVRFANGGPGGPGGNPGDPNSNPWGQPGYYVPVVPEAKKVAVYRFGSLPKDLPDWFTKLDMDKDAQVGLYEWRKGGRELSEFRSFDLNGDGFITVDEGLLPTKIAARRKEMGSTATASASGKPSGGDSSRSRGGFGGDRSDRGSSDRRDRGSFGRSDRGGFGKSDSGSSDRGSFGSKSDSGSFERPSKPEKPSKADRMEMKKERGGEK